MQLSCRLNFIGFGFREIRSGLTDIEQECSELLSRARSPRRPGCHVALNDRSGCYRFDKSASAYDPAATDPTRVSSFEVLAGKTHSPLSAVRLRKSRTISRLCTGSMTSNQAASPSMARTLRDVNAKKSLRAAIGMVPQTQCSAQRPPMAYNIRYGRNRRL